MRTPIAILSLSVLGGGSLEAQGPLPVLSELSPPGGRPGATARVSLVGKHLGKIERLWSDHPGIRAAPAPAPPAEEAAPAGKGGKPAPKKEAAPAPAWDVTVDAGVPPGLYDLRAVNDRGVSAPRAFHVSPLPLFSDRDPVEGRPMAVELESRIAGQVEAGLLDRFRFTAPAGARVVVECLAERIDSRLDATLEVRGPSGRRVAFSADRISLDPAVAFDAREAGEYSIDLWDFTYGGKFPYLLSISTGPRALFAFPPVLAAAGETELTVHGWNLPGGRSLEGPASGADGPLEALVVKLPAGAGAPRRLAAYQKTSRLLPGVLEARVPGIDGEPLLLAGAGGPITLEREPNDSPPEASPLPTPGEACGRFEKASERDWYSFRSEKGQKLEIELESARLGAPCDPVLLIARREKAKEGRPEAVRDLVFADERKAGFPREEAIEKKFVAPERDPMASFTAPEDGEYLIQVRNRNGRHGPDAIYRLSIRAAAPDFSLVVIHSENSSGEAATVPRGGSQSSDVLIERRGGFNGVVKVGAEGLPPGVSCPPVYLGPGESFVPLVFTASADAPLSTQSVQVAGVSPPDGSGAALRRTASSAVMVYGGSENRHPLEYVHSRLSTSLLLAVREPASFGVRLEPGERVAVPGSKVSFRAKVERREGFGEGVQLAYQGLGEKAFPEGNGNRPAKATMGKDKAEQEITVSIKGDAPYGERSFVVFASASVEYQENPLDPKSKKEKRRATFASNPVTVTLAPPFTLIPPPSAGPLAAGGTLRIPFQVRRLEGVDEEVEVALEVPGNGRGLSAEPVKVAKGKEEGELLLRCAPDAPAGRTEGALLRARVQFAGRRFEERTALPFAIERAAAFEVLSVEEARLGVLRLEVSRRLDTGDELPLRLEVVSGSGKEARGEAVMGKGMMTGAVLVDSSSLLSGGATIFPLRVRLKAAVRGGELSEEHVLTAAAPRTAARERKTRAF